MSANADMNPDHDQELNDDIYLTPEQLLWTDAIIEAVDEYIMENGEKYETAKRLIFGRFDGFSIFDHVFDSVFCNGRYRYLDPEDARRSIEKRRVSYQRKKRKIRLKRMKELKQQQQSQVQGRDEDAKNKQQQIKRGQDVKNQDRNGRRNRNSITGNNDRDTGNLENGETELRIEFILFGASS
uniref:Uncharacterized protein n=1 Tax=viral metagenome TaxID=1070528 RepID=A0A6H2A181_9ZZZZ